MSDPNSPDPQAEEIPQWIQDLLSKHADIRVVETVRGPCAFRPPAKAVWDRFISDMMDDAKKHMGPERLATSCLIHPSVEQWRSYLEMAPAISLQCLPAITEMAGQEKDTVIKKYGRGAGTT